MAEVVPSVPSPWTLGVARGFIIPFRVQPSTVRRLHITSRDKTDCEDHGLGLTMFVQYSSSPAGPYDEFLYALPFRNPTNGFQLMSTRRIPVIYVSTQSSVINGRKNWGVPKDLAKFRWTVNPGLIYSSTTVTVTTEDGNAPIGENMVKVLPSVQFYTLNIPFFVHLGLLKWACPLFMQKEVNENCEETPGDIWHAYKLGGYGWARLCWATQLYSDDGPGLFPSLKSLGGSLGIELTGKLVMPTPEEVVVDTDQKRTEGAWAHRRRALMMVGAMLCFIYHSKSNTNPRFHTWF